MDYANKMTILRGLLMSKASIETDLRDYNEFRDSNEIVFTNTEELSKYNEKL